VRIAINNLYINSQCPFSYSIECITFIMNSMYFIMKYLLSLQGVDSRWWSVLLRHSLKFDIWGTKNPAMLWVGVAQCNPTVNLMT
jgi:hypothetical protein